MIHRFKRALQMVLVAALVATGLAAVATPASADTTCPASGYFCAWTSANFTGSKVATNVPFTCQNLNFPYDDNLSSIKVSASPTDNDWEAYSGPNCAGTHITISNGQWIANLASLGFDNTITSIRGVP